ncbi:ITGA4 [Branchiostoma lanceolatum]|uniref:ITGA4 protein n=1 Tax=Branchiostoma lanceolatum TaxID=7740 RepID=A0A8J9YP41_BRALA|nr:ITGA4 [Branchiostoma lanceolatum]
MTSGGKPTPSRKKIRSWKKRLLRLQGFGSMLLLDRNNKPMACSTLKETKLGSGVMRSKCFAISRYLTLEGYSGVTPCAVGNENCDEYLECELNPDGTNWKVNKKGRLRTKSCRGGVSVPGLPIQSQRIVGLTEESRQDSEGVAALKESPPVPTDILAVQVGKGHFFSKDETETVASAPTYDGAGKVLIHDRKGNVLIELTGDEPGANFGTSVAIVDLNGDGLSELLVGAPLHGGNDERGQVCVYFNTGEGLERRPEECLSGSSTSHSRFGVAIEAIGDINKDGFQDVAIGAPFEDDKKGAVYIYHGTKDGLNSTYAQRISSLDDFELRGLKLFGASIAGGADMDGDGTADIAIGAPESSKAVIMKGKPVIEISAQLELYPDKIDVRECRMKGKLSPCFYATACFTFNEKRAPANIPITYTISADARLRDGASESRLEFFDHEHDLKSVATLYNNRRACKKHGVYLRGDASGFHLPAEFSLEYQLTWESSEKYSAPILKKTEENIRQKVKFTEYCTDGSEDCYLLPKQNPKQTETTKEKSLPPDTNMADTSMTQPPKLSSTIKKLVAATKKPEVPETKAPEKTIKPLMPTKETVNKDSIPEKEIDALPGSKPLIVPVDQHKIRLSIKEGATTTFHMGVHKQEQRPLDLFLLLDLSATMKKDLSNIQNLVYHLRTTMSKTAPDLRIGVGTIRQLQDMGAARGSSASMRLSAVLSRYRPSVWSPLRPVWDPEHVLTPPNPVRRPDGKHIAHLPLGSYQSSRPCTGAKCRQPFGFHAALPLTNRFNLLEFFLRRLTVSEGVARPEEGFDAMLQSAACMKKVGWRHNSLRMLVYVTDTPVQYVGDARLGDYILPNDGTCQLDARGVFVKNALQSTGYGWNPTPYQIDYPSIGLLKTKFYDSSIVSIFMVPKRQVNEYKNLASALDGQLGVTEDSSRNLVKMVKSAYERARSEVVLQTMDIPPDVDVKVTAACKGDLRYEDKDSCAAGDKVKFNVHVTLEDCPSENQDYFKIKPVGMHHEKTVVLDYTCMPKVEKPKASFDDLDLTGFQGQDAELAVDSDPCSAKFDDITDVITGKVEENGDAVVGDVAYAFSGSYLWKMGANGTEDPVKVDDMFDGLTEGIDSAFTSRWTRMMYFMKGSQIWRYTQLHTGEIALDNGFPRNVNTTGIPTNPDSSLARAYQIFFFKGNNYWLWNEFSGRTAQGYPQKIQVSWPGVPDGIQAAFHGVDGMIYFFKDDKYYMMDQHLLEKAKEESRENPRPWMGCK